MTNISNAVQSSAAMRVNTNDALKTVCSFLDPQECPKVTRVCKIWSRVFTPYNAMQYGGVMNLEQLSSTCTPRDRPDVYFQGMRFDREHSRLRTIRAYQIIADAPTRTLTSMHLQLYSPEHILAATQLFNSKALTALTELYVPDIPSPEFLQSIREGCPQLKSISTSLSGDITEAVCQGLNACASLTKTTLYSVRSDDDLQKLQTLNSLTRLQIENIGNTTTPDGLRHLSEGYPSLRMLCLSGGSAEGQPGLVPRPWVQRLVELESLAFRLLGLRLSHLTKVESACVAKQFLSKASKLQALEFHSSNLDPDCVKQLPSCPSLTDLDISCWNKGITEATIQTVAQCANLRFFTVDLPDEVDLGKALNHLNGHKTLEDLTLMRDELLFSPKPELLETASEELALCVKKMPALRVLELEKHVHPFVVKKLPHHNLYVRGGPPREKYELIPAQGPEKTQAKKG